MYSPTLSGGEGIKYKVNQYCINIFNGLLCVRPFPNDAVNRAVSPRHPSSFYRGITYLLVDTFARACFLPLRAHIYRRYILAIL